MIRRGSWAAGIALTLTACPGTPGSEGTGSTGEATAGEAPDLTEVLAELVQAHCDSRQSCQCVNDPGAATCQSVLSTRWQDRIEAGVARELTLDAACLDVTLAGIAAQGCAWPQSQLPPLCETYCAVYYGDVAVGLPCAAHDPLVSNCAQGLTCVRDRCTAPCDALGVAVVGQQCRGDDFGPSFEQCGPQAECDWDTGRCGPLGDLGESCDSRACQSGLWCDWDVETTCKAGALEGESCQNRGCATELYCAGPDRLCEQYAPLGASCGNRQCDPGLQCNASNVCAGLPTVGEACPQGQCADGGVCDFGADRCVALPPAGEPCVAGACAVTAWCEAGTSQVPQGICNPRSVYGQACTGHNQCETGYCPAGYCLDRPELGQACTAALPCANGLACNGNSCVATRSRASAVCVYDGW